MQHKNLVIVSHPLIDQSLTVIRDKTTKKDVFQKHSRILSTLLVIEATKHLDTTDAIVQTPLAEYEGKYLDDSIVFVPVLRAGLSMLSVAEDFLPNAKVGFVGLARDEETAIAKAYYHKLPQLFSHSQIFILDPMLATGGSLDDTIHEVKSKGGTHVTAICVVAAPEGVMHLEEKHPDVLIYTSALDSHLNEKKYIVPGLGDFGDRYFGT